ncbi:MAG: hypothetical protein HYX53_11980 [Chloroflexi bacterium]|nr:hypothetical protein [Chloroflexota bacterium]
MTIIRRPAGHGAVPAPHAGAARLSRASYSPRRRNENHSVARRDDVRPVQVSLTGAFLLASMFVMAALVVL